MGRRKYKWWHGVLFYLGVQAASFVLNKLARASRRSEPGESKNGVELYHEQRLPVFAPPRVAFPIAWTINNVSTIAGGLHVLNLSTNRKGRRQFLQLQGGAWVLFSIFQAAYFGLRSPINAEIVTILYTAVTFASLDVAIRKMRDAKAASSLATTVAWLVLANPVGLAVAAWNYDPLWKVGPFVEPERRWLKTLG